MFRELSPATASSVISIADAAIELQCVDKRFGNRYALVNVVLAVPHGRFTCITGPSGSGKTTLLRLIHGQIRPSRGRVVVLGRDLRRRWRLTALRRQVSFLHQDQKLLAGMTALENVAFAIRVTRLELCHSEVRRRALEALAAVGMEPRADDHPDQLSGGQRQRIAVARALATKPKILLADEPTSNLDDENAEKVFRLLSEIGAAGTTVLVATHDAQRAAFHGDQVIALRSGQIVRARSPRVARTAS